MDTKIYLSKFNFGETIKIDNLSENSVSCFELALENYLGENKQVVALNSGTSAIHLSLILAGVTEGDIVLCQSFTFVATVNPIIYQSATPIFIDSDHQTWGMCPVLLEAAIKNCISQKKKPKAIIINHSYGMPSKIEQIVSIAEIYDIKLIEDAASSLGSSYKNKKCGTFGDYGILSFNENKILTTFGGGVLVCNSIEDKNRAIYLATQAKENYNHYQHSEIGYNYRMDKVSASIGLSQIKEIDNYVMLRRAINLFYKDLFEKFNGVTVFNESSSGSFSNYWLSCIIIDEKKAGFTNSQVFRQLEKDNIEIRRLWKPMHLQPLYKKYKVYNNNVGENLFKTGLSLPSSSSLSKSEFERIMISMNNFL